MSVISIRVSEDEKELLRQVCAVYNCSISALMKKLVFERLEDEYDLQVIRDYENKKADGNLELYDHDDVWKELDI